MPAGMPFGLLNTISATAKSTYELKVCIKSWKACKRHVISIVGLALIMVLSTWYANGIIVAKMLLMKIPGSVKAVARLWV